MFRDAVCLNYQAMKAKFMYVVALAWACAFSGSAQVSDSSEFVVGGLKYRVETGTRAVLVGYTPDVPADVVIGQGVRYEGRNYGLSGVEAGSLAGCTAMRTLTFSALNPGIESMSFVIGDKAFDTPSLMEIVMMRPAPTVNGDPFSAETYADASLKVSTALTEEQQKVYETSAPWSVFFERDHGIVTGVAATEASVAGTVVRGGNGRLVVSAPEGTVVEVYTVSGRGVYRGAACDLLLPAGVYIVKAGDVAGKTVL